MKLYLTNYMSKWFKSIKEIDLKIGILQYYLIVFYFRSTVQRC